MYNNNNFGYGLGGGVNQNMPPKIKPTNAISEQEFREMIKDGAGVKSSIQILDEDTKKAICTHRNPATGESGLELIDSNDNLWKCKACGRLVNPLTDLDQKYIQDITNAMINIMETIKISWQNVPVDIIQNYFAAEAIIEKIPLLGKQAQSFMNSAFNQNPYTVNNQQNNAFSVLNGLTNGINPMSGLFNQGGYQQPNQWQQPNYNYQQNYQQGYQSGMQPQYNQQQMQQGGVSNAFGYNSPDANAMSNPNGVIMPDQQHQKNGETSVPAPREHLNVKLK